MVDSGIVLLGVVEVLLLAGASNFYVGFEPVVVEGALFDSAVRWVYAVEWC